MKTKKEPVTWKTFDSSRIKQGRYDPDDKTMELTFNNDKVYKYFKVPLEVWLELINSTSVGKAFSHLINTKYDFERIK